MDGWMVQYGAQYGTQYNAQYGAQYDAQYGSEYDSRYGSQYVVIASIALEIRLIFNP